MNTNTDEVLNITKEDSWFYNPIDGDNAIVSDNRGFILEAPDEDTGKKICAAMNNTYGAGINPESIPAMKELLNKYTCELSDTLKEVGELKKSFYMDICRAYNAGKDNMTTCHSLKSMDVFVSSHDYFLTEFPTFKTNVP